MPDDMGMNNVWLLYSKLLNFSCHKEKEKKSDPSKPNKKKSKEEEPRPVCEMKPRN